MEQAYTRPCQPRRRPSRDIKHPPAHSPLYFPFLGPYLKEHSDDLYFLSTRRTHRKHYIASASNTHHIILSFRPLMGSQRTFRYFLKRAGSGEKGPCPPKHGHGGGGKRSVSASSQAEPQSHTETLKSHRNRDPPAHSEMFLDQNDPSESIGVLRFRICALHQRLFTHYSYFSLQYTHFIHFWAGRSCSTS